MNWGVWLVKQLPFMSMIDNHAQRAENDKQCLNNRARVVVRVQCMDASHFVTQLCNNTCTVSSPVISSHPSLSNGREFYFW